MIKVACLSCSAPYDLDERRLPATGLKMRCPKCGTSFAVFPDGRVEAAATGAPSVAKKTQLGVAPPASPPSAAPKGAFGGGGGLDGELDLPAPVAPKPPAPRPMVPRPPAPAAAAPPDDLELDLPAPVAARPAPPTPGAIAAPAVPAPRKPIAMAPTPARPVPPPAPAQDLELDLPAPRAAVPKPAPADLELDLPAPRNAAPKRPAPADLDLDLPAPRGAVPKPAPAPADDLDLDLPAPVSTRSKATAATPGEIDLDLPAPVSARRAPPAPLDLDVPAPGAGRGKIAPPPSALADASRTPFDDDLDLPQPASKSSRGGGLELDLPAPKAARPPTSPGDDDPTTIGQRPAVLAAADDAFGDLDLPMPKGSAGVGGFGDLDLPAPSRGGVDLPAVSRGGVDLPTPSRGGTDLPAVSRGGVDLPTPSRGGVDLPTPSRGGVDLPTPSRGGVDLPTPSRGGVDLPGVSHGLDLPTPRGHGGGGGDGFGDLELPLPGGAPAGGGLGASLGDHDDLELPLPPGGGGPGGRASGPPRGHGELEIGGGSDDMEFADIPQASPDRAVATAPAAGRVARDAGRAKGTVAPVPARRSRAPLYVALFFVLLTVAGGALNFTPYGAFGIHLIEGYLPGAGDPAAVAQVIAQADALALHDVRSDSYAALVQLGRARHDSGLSRPLLAQSLLHLAIFDRRFGGDTGIATTAAAIRSRLEERGLDEPEVALGIAADELRSGDSSGAASFLGRARAHAPSDPFVDVIDGEIALAEARPADAVTAFRQGVEHGGGALAQWGVARALLTPGAEVPPADVDAAIEATLAASPRHAGARVAKARRLWDAAQEEPALRLGREVLGELPVEGEALRASGRDRADAYELLGRIHERRGRVTQAREAYEAATTLDATRVEALLGSGRTLLADRPSDALARFESVLGVTGAETRTVESGRTARDEARLGRARALLAVDRLEEARTDLETLAGERAEDAEIALWLGRAEERLDHDAAAETHYREAVRLAPASFDAYLALARLYADGDRGADALAVLEQARSQVAENAEMRQALGQFELARNRLPQAIRELRRALELDPALPAATFALGVALRRSGQLDEAARVFERTAELDPGHPGLALERGLLFEARGQADLAVEFYQAALRDHPEDPELMLRLGAAQVAAGRIDEAAATLEQAQRGLPNSAEVEHYLGRVAFARQQYPEAARLFDRAVHQDASRGEFQLYSAWAEIELGNIGRALQAANAAIERDPSLGDAFWIRGRVRLRAGAARDAIADLAHALELRPERVEAHAVMGDAYDEMRQLPQAIAAYERAVAARDTRGDWWYRLGRLRLDAGQRAEAARALGRATLQGETETPQPSWLAEAHRLQGDALRLGGERAGAIEHYRRFLEIAPPSSIDRQDVRENLVQLGVAPPE